MNILTQDYMLITKNEMLAGEMARRIATETEGAWQLTTVGDAAAALAVTEKTRIGALFIDIDTVVATINIYPGDSSVGCFTISEWMHLANQAGVSKDFRRQFPISQYEEAALVALVKPANLRDAHDVLDILSAKFDAVISTQSDRKTLRGLLGAVRKRESKDYLAISLESVIASRILAANYTYAHSPLSQAIGELYLTLGHDAKNYMSAISLNAQLGLEVVSGNKSIEKYFDRILGITADVIQMLLAFRTITHGLVDCEPADSLSITDLADLQHFASAAIRQLPTVCNVAVSCRIDPVEVAGGLCLPSLLLTHIILPLISNSVEAMNGNGAIHLAVIAPLSSREVEITVEDSGPGWGTRLHGLRVELEFLDLSGISTGNPLRGFGLKHVRRVLKRLGGELILEEASAGARVRIILPRRVFNG